MSAYIDVPEITQLHAKLQQCNMALAMIDDGTGTLTKYTIGSTTIAVEIVLALPGAMGTMAQIRQELINHQATLVAQLEALGVTDTPPAMEV